MNAIRVFFLFLLFVSSRAYSQTYDLVCDVVGYAYSYEKEILYQSRRVGFRYESVDRCTFEGPNHHALVQWRSFFDSEVPDGSNYKVRVKSGCGCYGERASGVARKFQDVKKGFVRDGFEVRRLKGFYPESKEINGGAPSGQVLLQY